MSETVHSKMVQAAYNNALWCDAVCRAHGGSTEWTEHVWFNRQKSPPFYPNVDTLTKEGVSAQMEVIKALLAANLPGDWGVKDSFCTLDLAPLGFFQAFEASWLWRPVQPLPQSLAGGDWRPIASPDELSRWEAAWSGGEVDPQKRIFPPALLADPDNVFLAAYQEDRIVAGAVASRTGAVVGVSNVFAPEEEKVDFWAGCISAVQDTFPGLPLVGYEQGDEVEIAKSLGFETIGPLRVWICPTSDKPKSKKD